jgi:pimeloyl-ACP methyl ester carboxylesterase
MLDSGPTMVPLALRKYLRACLYGVVYGCAIILFLVSALELHESPRQHVDIFLTEGACRTPISFFVPDVARSSPAAILIHGLSANRKLMYHLANTLADGGLRVFALDLPGHGDNTDPFTFARAQQCATVAVESLIHSGTIDPKRTALVGHSMGAGIAIRMADHEPVAATIAISPGPMPLPLRMPANLLVFSAQYDIDVLKRQAEKIQQAAGGIRTQSEDFAQQRAFNLEYVSHATHTSLIFDPFVSRRTGEWIDKSLDQGHRSKEIEFLFWPIWSQFTERGLLISTAIGFMCLMLFYPVCVVVAAKIAAPPRANIEMAHPPAVLALVEGLVFSFAGVLILKLGTPLKFLHIYAGDYLASLLFIVGVLFLALNRTDAAANFSITIRQKIAALVLGFATILAFGAWLNWQITDAWLNAPRWLRFAGLLPILWIYSYAEEVVLGPVQAGKRRASRFAIFLLLRLELWAACALAAYSLSSGHLLIVILFTFLAAFSILQRLATDALRLRIGSAAAAALFSAILAAWFIAAVFPLT